jgi:hypothetical protein
MHVSGCSWSAIEDFRYVNRAHLAACTTEQTLHVHQTARIDTGDVFHAVVGMLCNPILTHPHTDGFLKYAERTAKAATFISAEGLAYLQSGDHREQLTGL